ncbi:hypothetical protein CERSUDRAFT_122365 [Gelatoporia subvermispora B]|uniref:Uncharacterized protein n=1 Tax=Ceriporiopsis subvermispora (strain B) TaxID=914234 RepID=M2RK13_CERS8|nr:hypothetical protein CERSUDRAFT_122365 [Gelatoporia subvermispora B]
MYIQAYKYESHDTFLNSRPGPGHPQLKGLNSGLNTISSLTEPSLFQLKKGNAAHERRCAVCGVHIRSSAATAARSARYARSQRRREQSCYSEHLCLPSATSSTSVEQMLPNSIAILTLSTLAQILDADSVSNVSVKWRTSNQPNEEFRLLFTRVQPQYNALRRLQHSLSH